VQLRLDLLLARAATPCPQPPSEKEVPVPGTSLTRPLEVVGIVHTRRTATESTPIQAALNQHEHGRVEIFEAYADGLAGIEDFDYLWLLTWLDRPDTPPGPVPLTQIPFLLRPQQRAMGIFATRAPRRINPIGLSLVRILAVERAEIRFAGVDLLDGTPVIDIKPYVTPFDRPGGEPRCGWFDTVPMPAAATPEELGRRDLRS
jgi:tRNA-Thr(GGU) m(6)t(6)A37 methyltransferase TsaA